MNRIDLLVFKTSSYDTEDFIRDIVSYNNNSIILVLNQEKIKVGYKSPNVNFKKDIFKLYQCKSYRLNFLILSFKFLLDFFLFMRLLFGICWRYRPQACCIENTWAATIAGVLRKFHLCGKSIYLPGDWLASNKRKKNLSYIFNNILFPIFDYLACKLNDLVLNHTEQVAEARYKFWGKRVAKKEKLYLYKLRIKTKSIDIEKKNKNICFIGNIREDSGLEIVIKSFNKIREIQDISLKIIGSESYRSRYLEQLSKQYNVNQCVEILGFIETDRFVDTLSDCFCGINLLTSANSYSSYTIPGKIIHYLQYLLPVITTEGSGPFVTSIIRGNKLGLIIEPSQDAFVEAIFEIYRNQEQYRKNIIKYVNNMPQVNIKELIEV